MFSFVALRNVFYRHFFLFRCIPHKCFPAYRSPVSKCGWKFAMRDFSAAQWRIFPTPGVIQPLPFRFFDCNRSAAKEQPARPCLAGLSYTRYRRKAAAVVRSPAARRRLWRDLPSALFCSNPPRSLRDYRNGHYLSVLRFYIQSYAL